MKLENVKREQLKLFSLFFAKTFNLSYNHIRLQHLFLFFRHLAPIWSCLTFPEVLPAKSDITFVCSDHYLLSCPDDFSFCVNPCIAAGTFAAPADRLDFFYLISPCKQPQAAFKKILLKISTQAVTYYWNAEVIHDMNKKVKNP